MKKIKERLDENGVFFEDGKGKKIGRHMVMPGDVRELPSGKLVEVVHKKILLPVGSVLVPVSEDRYRPRECFLVFGEVGEAGGD